MYCKKCGNTLKKDDKFCNECGTSVTIQDHTSPQTPTNKKRISGNMLKLILAIICGLLVSIVILFISYNWGISISSGLAGGIICAVVKERTSRTGLGKVFGFISMIIGFILYRMLIFLFLPISMLIALIVFIAPYILIAYILIENEAQKSKNESQRKTITDPKTVTVYPKTTTLDPYFIDAGRLVIEKNKASIGMLQRVYKIGFNRSAHLMDQLYEAGVVGSENGTAPRIILMSMQEFENYLRINGYL